MKGKKLQTLTKYDKMKLVYLENDATYEISRTQQKASCNQAF